MKLLKIIKKPLLVISAVVILPGCSVIDDYYHQEDPVITSDEASVQALIAAEQNNVAPVILEKELVTNMVMMPTPSSTQQQAFHTHQMIGDFSDRLAYNLMKNSTIEQWSSAIVIASFVHFDDKLTQTSPLGNLLSESLLSQIQHYGMPVVDLHMKGWLEITNTGDYVFSRDVNEIMVNEMAKYVLSGVMIESEKGVMVNARIVEFSNQKVISSASVLIPHYVINNI